MMTKEEALELMKEVILIIKNDTDKLMTDRSYMLSWLENNKKLDAVVKELSSCDMLWIDEQYGPWFKENIEPDLPDLPDLPSKV